MSPIRRRGLMLVLSSPSGAGKTTISRQLLAREPDLALSVSVTTRPPRPGEVEGKDYSFVTPAAFSTLVAREEFLEHATVFDHCYGTPRAPVEAALGSGRDILFDVDWQGAQQLRSRCPDDVVGVFILPPSVEELDRRLRSRAQDSPEVVRRRMSKAADEMSHWDGYDYIIVNRDLAASVSQIQAILTAERLRRPRQIGLAEFVNGLRGH